MVVSKPRYRIGVIGTICGGTTYLAERLKLAGLDVRREACRSDGVVCGWWWSGRQPHKTWWDFDVRAQLIRHPLLVARTLPQYVRRRQPGGYGDFPWMTGDRITDALRFWVRAHRFAESWVYEGTPPYTAIQVRLGVEGDFKALCRVLGVDVPDEPPRDQWKHKVKRYPQPDDNWPEITWREWFARDREYALEAAHMVGWYELEEPTS